MEFARDLASADLWADSLERSLARRGRPRRASLELGRLTAERDLADPGTVGESTVYWRARRAASAGLNIPAPAVGGASVLALLAATTIPALGGGSSTGHRKGSLQRPASGSGTSGTGTTVLRHERAMTPLFERTAAAPASSGRYVLTAAHPAASSKVHLLGTGVPAAEAATDVHVLGATVASPATQAATGGAATTAQPKHVVYGKVAFGDLRDAQRMLGVPIDDVLGPKTGAAIRAFQAAHGLSVDGVIGPTTWNTLKDSEHAAMHEAAQAREAAAATRSVATSGVREAAALLPATTDTNDATDVMALQQKLGISADGTFGASTVAAVEAFQSAHGMTADGVVGPDTRIALGLGDGPTLVAPGQSGGTGDTTTPTTDTTTTAATTTPATTDTTTTDTTTASSDSTGATSATTPSSVTIALSEMIAAANQIQSLPYIWGGGHGSWVSPGYDCSGSVSYVLHAAGLLSVPEDSSGLESYGAPGPGQYITIYANAGHAWMTIEGRRFDTVALSESGSRWSSGGGEFAGYVVRHPVGF